MGMFDNTHAWSITLSVVFISFAIGMMAFAGLAPATKITTYLVAQAITLIAAVAVHGWGIYSYEKQRVEQHKALSRVEPKECPDYWTGRYDACTQSMVCDPYFDTADPHAPKVFMNGESLSPMNVQQHAAQGADQICGGDTNRTFPWLEVTNSCDARGRAV